MKREDIFKKLNKLGALFPVTNNSEPQKDWEKQFDRLCEIVVSGGLKSEWQHRVRLFIIQLLSTTRKEGYEEGKLLQSILENDPLGNPKGAWNQAWIKSRKEAIEECVEVLEEGMKQAKINPMLIKKYNRDVEEVNSYNDGYKQALTTAIEKLSQTKAKE